MEVSTELIAASCNLTYNCLELTPDSLIFGSNHALAVYDLRDQKVVSTSVRHTGRINCVRFLSQSKNKWILSGGTDGQLILWEYHREAVGDSHLEAKICHLHKPQSSHIVVCDGVSRGDEDAVVGYITSMSKVVIGTVDLAGGSISVLQELDLHQSVALEIIFSVLGDDELVMALGMDSGEVKLFTSECAGTNPKEFSNACTLRKHEDWVRSIAVTKLENGDMLLATGGEDSYIAIWRFKTADDLPSEDFEFQVIQFGSHKIVFDSMIIGHEGWINSLQWNSKGELISCSSDQTVIIWENVGEIWAEKVRLGAVGGQIPGAFCAKFNEDVVATSGFQGAIQIWSWSEEDGDWLIQPSVTGHFKSVTDLDYHPEGHYIVTTSADQTSRVFAPWGLNRWHEISRPQIHGHDIFALKCSGDYIVSGAEEKILRAFQPTQVFVRNYEDASDSQITLSNVAEAASLPALGLSNQTEANEALGDDKRLEERLEEDFLRSQTLWPEVSKLYGHGYEICAIGASHKDPIIVSGCNSSKPQFSTILLWCTRTWKNLGEFPFHKLNVTSLEFSADGTSLLSTSRDRTWALWKVISPDGTPGSTFSLELAESNGFHTRALSVGTWSPRGEFFVTGSRDKKLVIWKSANPKEMLSYENAHVQTFRNSVSAAAVNEDNLIAVGLETGHISIFSYNPEAADEAGRLQCLITLNNSLAHHDVVRKLKFNPREKNQLASGSADHTVKVYQLNPA